MVSLLISPSDAFSHADFELFIRDKVLIRALYFAERQHGFEKIMSSFGNDDTSAACLAYGYCKLLLEVRKAPQKLCDPR